MRTPTQRLADLALGQPVEQWIAERRAEGLSWRKISLRLRDVTNGELDVTPVTLSTWAESKDTAA